MGLLPRTDSAWAAFNGKDHYVTRVDRGKLDVERHTDFLNRAYDKGYKLHSIFEQNGNTVMVFEYM